MPPAAGDEAEPRRTSSPPRRGGRRGCTCPATSARAAPPPCRTPTCCRGSARTELRRRCRTTAAGQKPIVQPCSWSRQQMSTSSPAILNCGSKPPTASSASRRKAMLHPGMCSATLVGEQDVGRPARRVRDALCDGPRRPGARFGPPTPAWSVEPKACGEVAQPVAVGPGVVVGEGDDLARGRLDARVPGADEAAVLGPDQADVELARRSPPCGRSSRRRRRSPRSPGSRARRAPRRQRPIVASPLYVQTTTETRGPVRVPGERARRRTPARTAASAGFGRRSRSTRPKCQSSTSTPPRCHSSVQEKTNAPAQPARVRRAQLPLEHAAPGRSSPWRGCRGRSR